MRVGRTFCPVTGVAQSVSTASSQILRMFGEEAAAAGLCAGVRKVIAVKATATNPAQKSAVYFLSQCTSSTHFFQSTISAF